MNDETNTQPTDENGGMCADIDTLADVPYAVAPSVEKRINTIRLAFLPTVCWRIDDDRFDFDSSFILPTSTREFAMLADKRPPGPPAEPGTGPYVHVVQSGEWLDGIAKSYGFESWRDLYYADENAAYRTSHPDPNVLYPGDEIVIPGRTGGDTSEPQEDPNGLRLTVFGHADPTGRDDYNQVLAGRRAKAVYALLVRDVDMWDELYRVSHGGDEWTLRHIQIMLVKCGYDAGDPDGVLGTNTLDATRAFQRDKKFPASGYVDVTTRKKLFRAYMNAICVDSKHEPFQYNRKDFLSRGETKDGKADYQSCSEFNPMVVFSQEEEAEYAKPENKGQRDEDNAVNRRVTIYMFPPKPRFPPDKWPCPTIKEGCSKCKAQFWIDGEKRRSAQGERRDSRKRGKTMACKWYDRIVWRGACEGKKLAPRTKESLTVFVYKLGTTVPINEAHVVLRRPSSNYDQSVFQGATLRDGQTDPSGLVLFENLAAGEYSLEVSHSLYSMVHMAIRVPHVEQSGAQQEAQSFSFENAKIAEQQGKEPVNPPVPVPMPVSPTSVQIQSITFTSDHNLVNDYDRDYKDNTSPHIRPEWDSQGIHAVSHTMDQKVSLEVKCTVGPNDATQHTVVLRGTAQLAVPGTTISYTLEFEDAKSCTGGPDQKFELTSKQKLPKEVLDANFSIAWSASYIIPESKPAEETSISQSPQQTTNRMFVTYGTPREPHERTAGDIKSPVRKGFTLLRMVEAAESVQTRLLRAATGRNTASPLNPHDVAEGIMRQFKVDVQEEFLNEWDLAVHIKYPMNSIAPKDLRPPAMCYAIARLTDAIMSCLGYPEGEVRVIWAWASSPDRPVENAAPFPNMTHSGFKVQRLQRHPSHQDWSAGLGGGFPNKYEAVLKLNHNNSLRYHAPGFGPCLNARQVLRHFKVMRWFDTSNEPVENGIIFTYPNP